MIAYKDKYQSNCLEHIPPVFSNILEFKALAETYNMELVLTMNRLDEVHSNFFIDSLNEYGCTRWEKILKLRVNTSYTLEERRFEIKTKLIGLRPYTYKKLVNLLDTLVGREKYIMALDTATNHLLVKLDLGARRMMLSAKELLENTVPMNISLEIELLYNTHEMMEVLTHEQMEAYTHQSLKEEVFK
ncbi:putative phage tail protein [Peptostreptococcus sp.]|uniref:putative phage tail protein n=1 Tax=Peptostreptococcus sp. TaxID=1262 RepID=UPI00290A6D76|nr:putative phage tail protein [Peptostreptococcus sp.]MDU3423635.1 putative phage tail protein [Peptostreptococcus anaerobius]MDU3430490.1 putative phage tail protein [Peptostreptococcus sp.]MDU3455499.1 putative phage tail protein [Peptostreptococcus sp.]